MVHSVMQVAEWCIVLCKSAEWCIVSRGQETHKQSKEETVCQVYRQTAKNCESFPHKLSSTK